MTFRKKVTRTVTRAIKAASREKNLLSYKLSGRKAWTKGYFEYKWQRIVAVLHDESIMAAFRNGRALPKEFGAGIDERIVEYPWLLSHIGTEVEKLLDAGSALNFETILTHPALQEKKVTIANLNPESNCFWRRGVSYVFEDIRNLPFLPDTFDAVTCISTLEHIGMDNTKIYTKDLHFKENKTEDYLIALTELKRVLRPGGSLYLSVPFGKHGNFGFFQQFNSTMLRKTIAVFGIEKSKATFYQYIGSGWNISSEEECKNAEYVTADRAKVNPSLPAAASAVACLTFIK